MSAMELLLAPLGLRVVGVGVLAIVVALALAVLRHRRLLDTIERVLTLTKGGHTQEARVLARASGAWARPLVAALGHERPEGQGFVLGMDTLCAALALLGIVHGAGTALAMRLAPTADASMPVDVGALLVGMVVVTPLSLLSVAAIVRIGSTGRRRVRTAGVEVLVRQLQAAAPTASTRPRPKDTK